MTSPTRWRYVADNNASASFGLAADEYMTRRVGLGLSVPTLRLYTYRPHCALVGRHQNVDAEIQRAFCEENDIAINRRPTGGGAIIMGPDQLGVALSIPLGETGGQHRVRELFARFSDGIVTGLQVLGIRAQFGGKNDVQVGLRKVAGLGVYHDRSGGLLFHASVLVDLDVGLMLRVLRTPFEKISDKAIATVAHRVTTVRRETGQPVSLDEARAAIREGCARRFGVAFVESEFTSEEVAGIDELEREKYQSREWIEDKAMAADASGSGRVKTPGGLVNVELMLAGDVIKAICITGDFFAEDASVVALEQVLRWTSADPDSVGEKVTGFFAGAPDAFDKIHAGDFTPALLRAIEDAKQKQLSPEPYGCFVNP